jgi:hypothetical protein
MKLWKKTYAEKIAHEMLAAISEGSSDSESLDVESENEDAKIDPADQVMLSSRNQLSSKGKLMR